MARGLTINHLDEMVQLHENIPGSLTPIATITVPEKLIYTIHHRDLVVMKLYAKGTGQELDPNTDVVFSGMRPGRRKSTEIDGRDYRYWRALDLNAQMDANMNQGIRLSIPNGRLDLLESHKFIIEINSPDVVDWNTSFFTLDIEYAPYRDL